MKMFEIVVLLENACTVFVTFVLVNIQTVTKFTSCKDQIGLDSQFTTL